MSLAHKLLVGLLLLSELLVAQTQHDTLLLQVLTSQGEHLSFASVGVAGTASGTSTDDQGWASLALPAGYPATISIRSLGFAALDTLLAAPPSDTLRLSLSSSHAALDEVVITGTLTPTLRSESPVPVEVYTRRFLLQNPEPSLFEAMERVNGVRPQLNCAVCNTGDIHINGLEGPYTMITIDGMPIVSGLASVYGLQGIPTALIERIEVVKGPAGSLYGSEAVGGLINVITRDVSRAPRFSTDVYVTSLGEVNADMGFSAQLTPKLAVLTGIQGYYYDTPRDRNEDGFTDATLAKRFSLFQKWRITGGALEGLNFAARGLVDHRWGGELNFAPPFRGGTEVYGEAIDTRRLEFIGSYRPQNLAGFALSGSYTFHQQRSDYGNTPYNADQRIGFIQATYAHTLQQHKLLYGIAGRHTYYDDDSFATEDVNGNQPDRVILPGAFVQDEVIMGRHRLLAGLRYDYDARHGAIITPRIAYKMPAGEGANLRINLGTGFRVVNLFTEEHAALTGAREVVIDGDIAPERSVSANLNFSRYWYPASSSSWSFETATWATRFSNQILPDYLSEPTQIRYANLSGYSLNAGASAQLAHTHQQSNYTLGLTYADTRVFDNAGAAMRPLLSERWSATWGVSQSLGSEQLAFLKEATFDVDYNGTLYGPMLLPVLGPLDERPAQSPWWSIQNVQLSYTPNKGISVYGGVKNLLNFRPAANSIARSFDPFDREVSFDADGQPLATANNPQALVFDPSYVYAPNNGRRYYVGIRYTLD